jgi:hypothetical protein
MNTTSPKPRAINLLKLYEICISFAIDSENPIYINEAMGQNYSLEVNR